ncbi:polysaccharide pyruvyl transferase family protein [Candidatus Saccharibacteria bacterium]|nr:polysaccharide pyruvyl transferase family protein [Candidatus Saccharibacteria bacterium]
MKKNRLLISTLNGYKNYGNRLQLFALSTVLSKYIDSKNIYLYWPKKTYEITKDFIKTKYALKNKALKYIKIHRFTKKNTPRRTNKICPSDQIVVGSDQVWNPKYLKNRKYLIDFLKKEIRISYAASMGVEILSDEQKESFAKALKHYKAISVREESAKKLLQPLTSKEVKVVLDPTLLLNKIKYAQLEKKPKDIKESEKYILCYILGNREHQEFINTFAQKNNYRIILFSDKTGSNYGVEEFLYLIHHAQLICTDSFHACVFSFIFERPFIAFKRTGEANYMYSRLQNLIDTFHLKNREFNGKEITKENLEVDYSEAKKILKKEQEKSIKFLKNALDITEKSDG